MLYVNNWHVCAFLSAYTYKKMYIMKFSNLKIKLTISKENKISFAFSLTQLLN
jgi:hypothetical protein